MGKTHRKASNERRKNRTNHRKRQTARKRSGDLEANRRQHMEDMT